MAAPCPTAESTVSLALTGLVCAYYAKLFSKSHPNLLCMLWSLLAFCCLDLNGLLPPELVLEWLCVVIGQVKVKVPAHAAFICCFICKLMISCLSAISCRVCVYAI